MNNDFSKVKEGDRLWSPTFGWGEVHALNDRWLHIRNCNNSLEYYDNKGVHNGVEGYPQSLFFEEMILSPAAKPKEIKPFDPNKPYQRRDGMVCEIVHTFPNGRHIVVCENSHYSVSPLGLVYSDDDLVPADIINIPEMIEGWVNVCNVYGTKEMAKLDSNYEAIRMACIQVSFLKGEGL